MSIQQALFAGSSGSAPANWTLVDTWSNTQGNSVSMPDTQSGDIVLAFVGRRDSSPPSNADTFDDIERNDIGTGRIGYGVFARVCSGPTSFLTSTEFGGDAEYVFYCAYRALNAFTSTNSVLWKARTAQGDSTAATHNNVVASFAMNSLALPILWYSRTVGTTFVPPTPATLVGSDNSSADSGSVAVSSQEIGAAGNYSWGAWGITDVDNNWVTGYVEVLQP